jgi:miniconductance mechanosensitive channel
MFDGIFHIVTDRDGHRHFYAYSDSFVVATLLVIALLLLILLSSALCYYLTRFIMLWIVGRLARGERRKWLQAAVKHKVFDRLAPLVPAYFVYLSAPLISGLSFPVVYLLGPPLETLAACYMVLTTLRAAFAFLASIEDRYSHFPHASERPIKSFLQVTTIVLYLAALIALISLLLHRSPAYFLTGVGALLGFVASIQLAAYDMLRVGDWIEVPGFVADGTVVDIALNTITVRNFDNSIVTIPSYVLLSNGVKNWRGMVESGGRRLRHEIHLDVDSIRFGDEELFAKLQTSTDLQTPLIFAEEDPRLTNLGIFRRYLMAYFRQHPAIRTDMSLVVRLLQSTERGLPLEVFLYIDDTDWESFERIQSDMLDHVYGVLPQFGLRIWQKR